MVGFILTGHGHFADGIKSALDMVAGDQENFEIVPFEGSQAATYGDDLRAAITKMRGECEEGVIVFVDLLGGTPFNQSMMIANDVDKLEIITGSNLPMIIELLFARDVYKRQSMTFIGTPSVVCPVVLLCRYTQRLGHATRLNQLPSGIVPQMHAMTGSPCGLGRERTVHDQGAREGRGRLVHPV